MGSLQRPPRLETIELGHPVVIRYLIVFVFLTFLILVLFLFQEELKEDIDDELPDEADATGSQRDEL